MLQKRYPHKLHRPWLNVIPGEAHLWQYPRLFTSDSGKSIALESVLIVWKNPMAIDSYSTHLMHRYLVEKCICKFKNNFMWHKKTRNNTFYFQKRDWSSKSYTKLTFQLQRIDKQTVSIENCAKFEKFHFFVSYANFWLELDLNLEWIDFKIAALDSPWKVGWQYWHSQRA